MDRNEFEQRFAALLRRFGSTVPSQELKEAVEVATWYAERRLESFEKAMAYFDNASDLAFINACFLMGKSYADYHDPNNSIAVFHRKCVEQICTLRPELTLFQLHLSADNICLSMIERDISFVDAEPHITYHSDEVASAMHERFVTKPRMQ